MPNPWQRLGDLSRRGVAVSTVAATVAIELVTVALRFGLGLQSQTSTSWMAPLTFGLRIHHGYWGIVMLAAALGVRRPALRNALLILGGALFFSDMIHHFLVLWPVIGSPEFHFTYDCAG